FRRLEGRRELVDERFRGIIRDEMASELYRYMVRGRGMSREAEERGLALVETGIDIGRAEKALIARLMRVGEEDEGPRRAEAALGPDHGPARDDPGKRGHVILRIAAIHTERVELENLARQILVETTLAVLAGHGIRPEGLLIVEEEEHGGMRLDSQQHVGEAPEDMRSDRFALEGTGDDAHMGPLRRRDGEMVRPEHGEPLSKADARNMDGAGKARL